MITIITTIIVSILAGIIGPIISPGINFPAQNLFSQIGSINSLRVISQLPTKSLPVVSLPNLSKINPMESLENATAPLNDIWKALSKKLDIENLVDSIKSFLNGRTAGGTALKSSLESGLGVQDTSTVWQVQVLGIAKSAFILIANILVTVLEIVLWLLKGVLGLIR